MTELTKWKKLKKKNLRIMSKQYAHLHAMAKTSVKFQNDWQKNCRRSCAHKSIVDERTNVRVTARLYRTCVLTQVRQKKEINARFDVTENHTIYGIS